MQYALKSVRDDLSEETWALLHRFAEIFIERGQIDASGMLAKLIFEAVLGSNKVDEQLTAMGQQFATKRVQEGIAELLDKVHRPSCARWETMRSDYLRSQGHIDDDPPKMSP